MRNRILIFFLVIITNHLFGQDKSKLPYSIINFVRSGSMVGSACILDILVPNQRQFFINPKSVVRYKVYSEGQMTISLDIICRRAPLVKDLDITAKRGNEYYIFIGINKFEVVDKTKVIKFFKTNKRIKEIEENIEYPIIKSSLKNLDIKD